jgi:hypothetical protein
METKVNRKFRFSQLVEGKTKSVPHVTNDFDETKGALKSAGNIVVKLHYVKNVRLDHEPNRNALTLPNHGAIPEKALKSAAPSPNKVRTPRDPMFM